MLSGFNCYFQFIFNTDNNELTLVLDEVEDHEIEDTGIEKSKTIILTNPLDIDKSKQEALEMTKAMLRSAGKYSEDYSSIMDTFSDLMNKVKEEIACQK